MRAISVERGNSSRFRHGSQKLERKLRRGRELLRGRKTQTWCVCTDCYSTWLVYSVKLCTRSILASETVLETHMSQASYVFLMSSQPHLSWFLVALSLLPEAAFAVSIGTEQRIADRLPVPNDFQPVTCAFQTNLSKAMALMLVECLIAGTVVGNV